MSWLLDAIKKARSAPTAKRSSKHGKVTECGILRLQKTRACDHQLQSARGIATVQKPTDIPEAIRFLSGLPLHIVVASISQELVSAAAADTKNDRCIVKEGVRVCDRARIVSIKVQRWLGFLNCLLEHT